MLPMPTSHLDDPHRYIAPGPNDVRSPCPALNTLANHGYLNRDGKNLTAAAMIKAVKDLFHVSIPLGSFLAISGVVLCGNGRTVTLEQLRKHNAIEHDASLSRYDARTGDNFTIVPELVEKIIAEASGMINGKPGVVLEDLARLRAARDATLPASSPLDSFHGIAALTESSLILSAWGLEPDGSSDITKRVIPVSRIESFFLHEKFPDGWYQPPNVTGFVAIAKLAIPLSKLIKDAKDAAQRTDEKCSEKLTRLL